MKYHQVWRVAWDGEISMSGKPHTASIGTEFLTKAQAQNALKRVPGFTDRTKPNIRIESRFVTDWEIE